MDYVYALNATTGISLWSYSTGSEIIRSPAVVGNVLYIGSGYNVYALDSSPRSQQIQYAMIVVIITVVIVVAVVFLLFRMRSKTKLASPSPTLQNANSISLT